MSEFGPEPASHLSWRDQHLERDTSSGISTEQDAHQGGHRQSQPHLYNHHHHYTPPPAVSETEEWSASASHEGHGMVGSPQSQASSSSMIDSPRSQQSENRRSVDMTASAQSTHNDSSHMSLNERRQEKRKMKRFRLTHNQTRFLMSEFARQAHPDAAHRERLAREIPGLSPRQVQVWFQNRRAKLKRMSSDDRERMMKSRALPEEFPILQTLHTYGARMIGTGTPVTSPTDYSPTTGGGIGYHHHRPDPLRRRSHLGEDENSSAYGLSFTSTTSSEMLSGYMTAPLGPQQRGNPFSRATDPYRAHPSVPRLQLHDIPRSLNDNAGNMASHDDYQHSPGGYSLQGMPYNEPPRSVPPDTPSSPYVHSNPGGFTHPYPSPVSHGRQPSFPPPPLTLSEPKYTQQPPLTPHSGSTSGFTTAPLSAPQEYQVPQMSAPADATSFASSYLTRGPSGSLGSAMAPNTPASAQQLEGDRPIGRLSISYSHKRQRSSSHPPSFPQHRNP